MRALYLGSGILLAALCACSGTSQQSTLPALQPQGSSAAAPSEHARPWMARGLKNTALLYVTNQNGLVNVYSYAQGTLVGVLTPFSQPEGECADFSGNVYITDSEDDNITEYAHGSSSPTRVIAETTDHPIDCAVASNDGNLAVANFNLNSSRYNVPPGSIAVYPHGTGKPTIYEALSTDEFQFDAYDNNGDLFAISRFYYYYSIFYRYEFYYLPKGGSTLISMSIPGPSSSGSWEDIQGAAWDGKYFVIESGGVLYRYIIDVKAVLVSKVALSGGSNSGPLAIYRAGPKSPGTQAVGASATGTGGTVYYWDYPGGETIGSISKYLDGPYGVAISL